MARAMATADGNFFTRNLSSGERLGELLFGLIMTLTFTLTAGCWSWGGSSTAASRRGSAG